MTTTSATPIPMPAFAPFESPVCAIVLGVGVPVAVEEEEEGLEVVVLVEEEEVEVEVEVAVSERSLLCQRSSTPYAFKPSPGWARTERVSWPPAADEVTVMVPATLTCD